MSEKKHGFDEQAIAWGKQCLNAAIDELARQGVIDTALVEARISWMLPQQLLIAELRETSTSPPALWVIAGDGLVDNVDVALADAPRDAARHFGMKWQLAVEREGGNPELEARAELLLGLAQVDNAWT
jgi:hypothetical protein